MHSDVFDMTTFQKMTCPTLISWLRDTATLQEAHPFHGTNWPDWVPGPAKFRQHADALTVLVKAAEHKDREKSRERDEEQAETLTSVNSNASYIVIRWRHEKDDSLLNSVGYVLKDQSRRGYGPLFIHTTPLLLQVKNGRKSRSVTVKFEKDQAAGLYHLQICKGHPTGEESWGDQGHYKNCRIVIEDLELATWYYFRVRSIGNNQASPWSAPVGIIVV